MILPNELYTHNLMKTTTQTIEDRTIEFFEPLTLKDLFDYAKQTEYDALDLQFLDYEKFNNGKIDPFEIVKCSVDIIPEATMYISGFSLNNIDIFLPSDYYVLIQESTNHLVPVKVRHLQQDMLVFTRSYDTISAFLPVTEIFEPKPIRYNIVNPFDINLVTNKSDKLYLSLGTPYLQVYVGESNAD